MEAHSSAEECSWPDVSEMHEYIGGRKLLELIASAWTQRVVAVVTRFLPVCGVISTLDTALNNLSQARLHAFSHFTMRGPDCGMLLLLCVGCTLPLLNSTWLVTLCGTHRVHSPSWQVLCRFHSPSWQVSCRFHSRALWVTEWQMLRLGLSTL